MKLDVPDMSCGHCKAAVESALKKLDPDAGVTVDLANRKVDFDGKADAEAVVAALATVGFPARVAG